MIYNKLMDSIWDSLRLFRQNLMPLSGIILPFAIFMEIFDEFYKVNYISETSVFEDTIPILLVHLLIHPFYSVAIVFYLSSIISNKSITVPQVWLLSIKYWPSYLLLSVLLNLFVFSGLMLFVIPGIFLFIRFLFAEFYLLLEQKSPIEAIKFSVVNTKDYFLILFSGFLMLGIFTVAPFLMITEALAVAEQEINLLSILISIIFDIVTIIFTVFAFRIYHLSKENTI